MGSGEAALLSSPGCDEVRHRKRSRLGVCGLGGATRARSCTVGIGRPASLASIVPLSPQHSSNHPSTEPPPPPPPESPLSAVSGITAPATKTGRSLCLRDAPGFRSEVKRETRTPVWPKAAVASIHLTSSPKRTTPHESDSAPAAPAIKPSVDDGDPSAAPRTEELTPPPGEERPLEVLRRPEGLEKDLTRKFGLLGPCRTERTAASNLPRSKVPAPARSTDRMTARASLRPTGACTPMSSRACANSWGSRWPRPEWSSLRSPSESSRHPCSSPSPSSKPATCARTEAHAAPTSFPSGAESSGARGRHAPGADLWVPLRSSTRGWPDAASTSSHVNQYSPACCPEGDAGLPLPLPPPPPPAPIPWAWRTSSWTVVKQVKCRGRPKSEFSAGTIL
mmetsp:Transcript_17974/g.41154  ORF Transcript_17974/g.41154 Transcript_17974/m.41154 type:complete len:394 (-) Transcript_17974:914-2095(-)